MQFVGLIYQGTTPLPGTPAWEALPAAEQQQVYADYGALNADPSVQQGLPLGLAEKATTVRVRDGAVATEAGPLLGAEGAVAGWFVIEADDVSAAIAVAARVPAARLGGAVEVRPVETYW